MNISADKFTWSAYNTTQNTTVIFGATVADGLTLDTNEAAASANVVKEGDSVVLTGVLKADSTVQASTTLTVTKIVAANLTLNQPVLPENTDRLMQNAGYVEVPYSLVDSEGKAIKFPETAETPINSFDVNGVKFTTENNDIVTNLKVDAKGKLWAKIADKGGDVSITALVKSAGKVSVLNFKVNENAYSDTISLGAPETQLTASGSMVKIPLTVTDQYGSAVAAGKVKASDFVVTASNPAVITSSVVSTDGKYLEVTPNGEGTASITITSIKSGKSATTSVDVKKAAVPTDITASASSTNVLKGASLQVKGEVLNQYGGGFVSTLPTGHKVVIKGATQADADAITVEAGGNSITDVTTKDFKKDGYKVTVKADANVSSVKLNVELQKADNTVVATKVLTVNVAGETTALTYSIKPVNTISGLALANANSEYAKELVVVAKDASGSEVTIPSSRIQNAISENTDLVNVAKNSDGVYAVSGLTAGITGDGVTEKSTTVRLLVEDTDGSLKTVETQVTVSKAALTPVAIKAVQDADAKKEVTAFEIKDAGADGTLNELVTGIKVAGTGAATGTDFNFLVEDQFEGKSILPTTYTVTGIKGITFGGVSDNISVDTSGATHTLKLTNTSTNTVWTKDAEFIVTAVTANGLTKSVKVTFDKASELVKPTVNTKLAVAGDITTTGSKTLVFLEDIDAASRSSVKAIVDGAFTANGTSTVSSTWTDNKTLTVTIGGTVDASTNKVVLAALNVPADFKVKDLAGNESAVLAVSDLQTP